MSPEHISEQVERNKREHDRIWNAAIEAAAKEAEIWMDDTVPTKIRKLKK